MRAKQIKGGFRIEKVGPILKTIKADFGFWEGDGQRRKKRADAR